MNDLSINGEWPNIENEPLEELLVQEFWWEGKLEDQANLLYLKVSSNWYRLYFDYSIIFWRIGDNGLNNDKTERNKEFGYPLVDLGKELNLLGQIIIVCKPKVLENGVQVKFEFSNEKTIVIRSINDERTIEI